MGTNDYGSRPPAPDWEREGPSTPPGPSGARGGALAPHRGTAVLVLGILGIVACFICGIVAWAMGGSDLKAMREGRMDPSGESMTKAGWICGIVGTCLNLIGLLIFLIIALTAGTAAFHFHTAG